MSIYSTSCEHPACDRHGSCRLPDWRDEQSAWQSLRLRRLAGDESLRELGADPLDYLACDSDDG